MEAHIFLKEVHLLILVIAEKPSVAQSIAKVLGATSRKDGYLEGNNYMQKALLRQSEALLRR